MSRQKKYRRRRREKNWFLRLSKGKKIAVCTGGAFVLMAIIGVIYLAVVLNKIQTDDVSGEDIIVNEEVGQTGEGYTNVALFGIDSRSGELEKGTRTDCLIVASLNNETKEVKMISVYRDTVLDIEDNYLQKCNAAYAFGGPTQAINMLNKNLDLNIQDYATVDFAAIANAIDMLGGLEIEIKPEEVAPLNKFVRETARVAGKDAHTVSSPGLQLLDGVQATTYARIRSTAGGDFTRTERQRLVIEKIVEKAQKSDFATINKIIDEVLPTIKTSFTAAEILHYAKDFMKYDIVDSSGFPFEKTTATISGLGSIVIPVTLSENVIRLHEYLYDTVDYEPSSIVTSINDAIVARVGQREATDYSTLSNKTYVDTPEDKAQEKNEYTPKPEPEESTQSENKPEDNKNTSTNGNTDKEDNKDTNKDTNKNPSKPNPKPEDSKPEDNTGEDNTTPSVPENNEPDNSGGESENKPDDGAGDGVGDSGSEDSGEGTGESTDPQPENTSEE